jgi:hypothetical protein
VELTAPTQSPAQQLSLGWGLEEANEELDALGSRGSPLSSMDVADITNRGQASAPGAAAVDNASQRRKARGLLMRGLEALLRAAVAQQEAADTGALRPPSSGSPGPATPQAGWPLHKSAIPPANDTTTLAALAASARYTAVPAVTGTGKSGKGPGARGHGAWTSALSALGLAPVVATADPGAPAPHGGPACDVTDCLHWRLRRHLRRWIQHGHPGGDAGGQHLTRPTPPLLPAGGGPAASTVRPPAAHEVLTPPDLAMLLVCASRVGLPGWAGNRPPSVDATAVEVLWVMQQRAERSAVAAAERRHALAAAALMGLDPPSSSLGGSSDEEASRKGFIPVSSSSSSPTNPGGTMREAGDSTGYSSLPPAALSSEALVSGRYNDSTDDESYPD